MATRSAIIVKVGNSDYRGVYCHNDGYPKGVGKTLKENFNTLELAKELIELGDLSCVAGCTRIKPLGEHTFQNPEKGTVLAYHRDRGEEYHAPEKGSMWSIVAREIDHEYAYVFEDGVWTCYYNK